MRRDQRSTSGVLEAAHGRDKHCDARHGAQQPAGGRGGRRIGSNGSGSGSDGFASTCHAALKAADRGC